MITKSNFSLPYPAIGLEGDFTEGYFSVKPNIYSAEDTLHINEESVEISNEYIKELYDNGVISTVYKIDCPPTFFNFCSSKNKHIEIPLSKLAKFINIEVFLIVTDDIDNYHDDSFNKDYFLGENKGVFQLQKGNIIGFAGSQKITLDSSYTKGGSSLFKFRRSGSQPISIDVEDSLIQVTYPHIDEKLDIINTMPRTKKLTFLNLFIVPALQEAFLNLKKADENDELENYIQEHKWAYILSEGYPNYTTDEPFTCAQNYLQTLLKNGKRESNIPVLDAFYNELS